MTNIAKPTEANDPDRFRKPAPVIDLTPEVISELQRLLDDAQKIASVTGLPWRSEPSGGKPVLCANKGTKGCCIAYGTIGSWNQIDLAVAAVNALPALLKVALSSAPQEPDDELIERLKDMRDFCRGTTHTHPHPNNVARLCEDVLAVLQAKAPETGEPQ
jgi:hypothetical protein